MSKETASENRITFSRQQCYEIIARNTPDPQWNFDALQDCSLDDLRDSATELIRREEEVAYCDAEQACIGNEEKQIEAAHDHAAWLRGDYNE